jgi:protein TonB
MKKWIVLAALLVGNMAAHAQVPAVPAPKEKGPEIFTFVEQKPEFPGGDNAMLEYIKKNIHYPQQAIDEGIEGRVIVKFVITDSGKVEDVKVQRGIGKLCDEEAVRVIKSMPLWKPGRLHGKDVNTYYSMPVMFKLSAPAQPPATPAK